MVVFNKETCIEAIEDRLRLATTEFEVEDEIETIIEFMEVWSALQSAIRDIKRDVTLAYDKAIKGEVGT